MNDYNCVCADGYTGKNCSVGRRVVSASQTVLSSQLNFLFHGESNQEDLSSSVCA